MYWNILFYFINRIKLKKISNSFYFFLSSYIFLCVIDKIIIEVMIEWKRSLLIVNVILVNIFYVNFYLKI